MANITRKYVSKSLRKRYSEHGDEESSKRIDRTTASKKGWVTRRANQLFNSAKKATGGRNGG